MFTQPYTALRIRTQLYAVELVLRNSKRSTQQYSLYASLQSFTQQNTVYAAEHSLRSSTRFTQLYALYAAVRSLRICSHFTQSKKRVTLRSFTQLYAAKHLSFQLRKAIITLRALYARFTHTLRALYANFTCP